MDSSVSKFFPFFYITCSSSENKLNCLLSKPPSVLTLFSYRWQPVLKVAPGPNLASSVHESASVILTTIFVDTRLWKTKHPWKHFRNIRQSCVISTDRIENHQSQPLVWPSGLLYVMLAGCDWWISIWSVDNTQDWWKFWKRFHRCFVFESHVSTKNGGNSLLTWASLHCSSQLSLDCCCKQKVKWPSTFCECENSEITKFWSVLLEVVFIFKAS